MNMETQLPHPRCMLKMKSLVFVSALSETGGSGGCTLASREDVIEFSIVLALNTEKVPTLRVMSQGITVLD